MQYLFPKDIREAGPDDNEELKALQLKCPQGEKIILSVVNTPDFFARTKAYQSSNVLVALDGGRIVGSTAIALRNAVVNGEISRIGYGFQAFVAPEYRRKGILNRLAQQAEDFSIQQGIVLMYCLIIENNLPAMRLFEHRGYKLHKKLIVAGLPVFKKMTVSDYVNVRPAVPEDLPAVAEILNATWQGFEMYEPTSAEALNQFVSRTPGYNFDNLLVLLDGEEVQASLGYWDWSKIIRVRISALSLKIRLIGLIVRAAGLFRPMPEPLKPGDLLNQIILSPIGFKDPAHFATLLRHVNNRALQMGIKQIFCIGEPDSEMQKNMKGFIRINTTYNLYVKAFKQDSLRSDKPVYVDGIDL